LPEKVRYLEGGGQQVQKVFAEAFDAFSRKDPALNPFTIKFTGGVTTMKERNIVITV